MIPRSLFVLALPKKNTNTGACFLSQCWSLRSRITLLCLDGVRSGLSQISHVQMMCVLHLEIYGGQKILLQISSNILNSARSHSEIHENIYLQKQVYANSSKQTEVQANLALLSLKFFLPGVFATGLGSTSFKQL